MLKFKKRLGMPDIPGIFGELQVDARLKHKYQGKMRVPPPLGYCNIKNDPQPF